MQMTCPNQERIGCVRCALITVAAPFYDEAQIVFAGKIDSGSDVGGVSCGDGVDAGFGGPSVDPTQGLGNAGIVANVVRVFHVCEERFAVPALGRGYACADRKIDLNKVAANRLVAALPGSVGRPT